MADWSSFLTGIYECWGSDPKDLQATFYPRLHCTFTKESPNLTIYHVPQSNNKCRLSLKAHTNKPYAFS